ncbi:MAG: glycosyltransferase [Planctomycetaceae bacterium]|nr:glycosyltransferase [Planctomycetaceae bacterium]
MSELPRLTIITPSLNQAQSLERTIRSVLDQNYPNLEYLVIDGGSTDGSKEIIEKYADRLHWWCSQNDRGPAHALNKGLDKATGDLITTLNSNDWYLPGVLHKVGEFFRDKPKTDFLYGQCQLCNAQGEYIQTHRGNIFTLEELLDLWNVWRTERRFLQPECFWSRRVFLKVRSFREDLTQAYDYEYWTRLFLAGARVERLEADICGVSFDENKQTADEEWTTREELEIIEPILWNPQARLSPTLRRKLQADWLFDAQLQPTISESASQSDPHWKQYLKVGQVILRHPIVLYSDRLWQHFNSSRQNDVQG